MGCTYEQYVVVGVRLSELFQVEHHQTSVTKYNQDTGVPYQQPVTVLKFLWRGQEIPEPDEYYPEEFVTNLAPGMDVYSSGESARNHRGKGWNQYDFRQFIVGVAVAKTGESGGVDGIEPEALEAAKQTVKDALGMEPQLYLVSYISC